MKFDYARETEQQLLVRRTQREEKVGGDLAAMTAEVCNLSEFMIFIWRLNFFEYFFWWGVGQKTKIVLAGLLFD